MYQRLLMMKAWEDAGLTKSKKKKVRSFLEFVEQNPQLDLEEYLKEFKEKYDEVYDDLIPPLMEIDNNLIILNLLQFFDPRKRRKDLNLLKKFIGKADAIKLQPSLEAIAELKIPSLTAILMGRKDLLPQTRRILLES